MNQQQLREMIGESLLNEVIAINLNDIAGPDDEIQEEENIVGAMNDMEKRFYGLSIQKLRKAIAVCNGCKKGDEKSIEEKKVLCLRYVDFLKESKRAADLMWKLIEMKFGHKGMAIRKDFQIEENMNTFIGNEAGSVDLSDLIEMIKEDMEAILSGSVFQRAN